MTGTPAPEFGCLLDEGCTPSPFHPNLRSPLACRESDVGTIGAAISRATRTTRTPQLRQRRHGMSQRLTADEDTLLVVFRASSDDTLLRRAGRPRSALMVPKTARQAAG